MYFIFETSFLRNKYENKYEIVDLVLIALRSTD